VDYAYGNAELAYGRRAFSVSGPVIWNSLPDYLRDHTLSHYRRLRFSLLADTVRLINSHSIIIIIIIIRSGAISKPTFLHVINY